MRNAPKMMLAALALAMAAPLALADPGPGCMGGDEKAMKERVEKMDHCMRRAKDAKTPAERQKAMDDHMKEMHEAMGGMRGGKGKGCHGAMMGHMSDQMTKHRAAIKESGG